MKLINDKGVGEASSQSPQTRTPVTRNPAVEALFCEYLNRTLSPTPYKPVHGFSEYIDSDEVNLEQNKWPKLKEILEHWKIYIRAIGLENEDFIGLENIPVIAERLFPHVACEVEMKSFGGGYPEPVFAHLYLKAPVSICTFPESLEYYNQLRSGVCVGKGMLNICKRTGNYQSSEYNFAVISLTLSCIMFILFLVMFFKVNALQETFCSLTNVISQIWTSVQEEKSNSPNAANNSELLTSQDQLHNTTLEEESIVHWPPAPIW